MRSFPANAPRVLLGLSAFCLCISQAHADPTDLSHIPIDSSIAVPPNIALTYDDSGSMGYAYLPDSVQDGLDVQSITEDLCSPGYYWSGYNKIYYNPSVTYDLPAVPKGMNGLPSDAVMPAGNVKFPVVPLDGYYYYLGIIPDKIDLTSEYYPTVGWYETTGGYSPKDNHGTFDGKYFDSNSGTYTPCLPDAVYLKKGDDIVGIRAFYYTGPDINNLTLTIVENSTAEDQQNFANWYSYYRTRNLMTKSSLSRAIIGFSQSVRLVAQNINNPNYLFNANTEFTAFTDATRVAFFNWLYRIEPSGGTPNRHALVRAGDLFTRPLTKDAKDPFWNGKSDAESKDLACRQNFHMLVTDGRWSDITGNPPPPPGFVKATEPGSLPDGHSYTPETQYTYIYSHQEAPPNTGDGCDKYNEVDCSPTLADLAYHYWATDLQPDLENKVPPYFPHFVPGKKANDDEIYFHPDNDPATWQHLVQYMVALGVNGTLSYPDGIEPIKSGAQWWPAPGYNTPAGIDDTWHAAINSRGQYLNVSNSQNLIDAISKLLKEVAISRKGVSTSAATTSSGVLTAGNLGFVTGYDSTAWSGALDAYKLDPETGKFDLTPTWEAAIPSPDSRVILSSKSTGPAKGIEFKWDNLSAAQQLLLDANPDSGKPDSLGSLRVDYLRGDTSHEGQEFRARSSLLGAIIDSQAVYIAYPTGGYRSDFGATAPESQDPQKSYEKFAAQYKDRLPTLYVGANDGMLHAFAAVDDPQNPSIKAGTELFAYVPNAVYSNLGKYTSESFKAEFRQTVNNSPVVRDVFFGGAWHTILIGSLRFGGRGIFALDVTNPKLTPGDTAKVLWEFDNTSPGGANLGYTYGVPNIARLPKGNAINGQETWVVLLPVGYFPADDNAADDDPASKRQQSSLFVLDVQTGALIKELVTPVDNSSPSWGLAAPVVGDYDDDQIDDVAYAGDLKGNLFRFDLHSGNVERTFTAPYGEGQPITVMPRLFPDPVTQRLIVLFGTGKYIGQADNNLDNPSIRFQALYGIRDYGSGSGNYPIKPDQLVEQQIKHEGLYREVTDKPVPPAARGWSITFTDKTERVTAAAGALFNTNRAIFSIVTPSKDSCTPGRSGYMLILDAANGGPSDGGEAFGGTGPDNEGFTRVGIDVDTPPASGIVPVVAALGGGQVVVPGVPITGEDGRPFGVWDNLWKRQSWRDLEIPYE